MHAHLTIERRPKGALARRGRRFQGAAIALLAIALATSCDFIDELLGVDRSVPVPTELEATAQDGAVLLTWNEVLEADSYTVYRKAGSQVSVDSSDGTTSTEENSILIEDLDNGTQYAFIVIAKRGRDNSAASRVVLATPNAGSTDLAAPTDVQAAAGNASATLSWTASARASSYKVHYAAGTTATDADTSVEAVGATSVVVGGLTNGTQYAFVVVAHGASTASAASAVVTATPNGGSSTTPLLSGNLLANPEMSAADTSPWSFVVSGSGWVSAEGIEAGSTAWVSSYSWGTISQTVDLLDAGCVAAQLDDADTVVRFELKVTRWQYGPDPYYLTLELLDAAGAVLATVSDGTQASPQYIDADWTAKSLSYANTGAKAIRKARVTIGGRDKEGWNGPYGTGFCLPKLTVEATPQYRAVHSAQGLYTYTMPSSGTVEVKAWGAGGAHKSDDPGSKGGAGAFAQSTFTAAAGQAIHIAVGAGGGTAIPSGYSAPAMGGRKYPGGVGGDGGGGSVVALYNGTSYVAKAVAGGGGANGGAIVSAGQTFSAGGQAGYWGGGSPGVNGTGGSAVGTWVGTPGNAGQNMTLSAASFAGLGGAGGDAANHGSGAGGGGYGGGSSVGHASYYYDGAGGGCYSTGEGAMVLAGSGISVANTSDPDYVAGAGTSGTSGGPGGDGLVVITVW